MLIPRQFRRLCVQPLRYVDRKVMLYPVGERQPQYLVIDPEGPIDLENVTIPYLPGEQEVVLINNGTLVHVSAVTANKVTCRLSTSQDRREKSTLDLPVKRAFTLFCVGCHSFY